MEDQAEPTAAQHRLATWRYRVEEARVRKRFMPKPRKTPAAVPPTARRLMVLLAWIANREEGMVLATKRCPPLTLDMKTLVAKDYCRLERGFPVQYPEKLAAQYRRTTVQRVTRIRITEAGRKVLAKTHVPAEDHEYMWAALQTMTLL